MRLFLAANILFTAAHNPSGKAALVISYARAEAHRNLQRKNHACVETFAQQFATICLVAESDQRICPDGLAEKTVRSIELLKPTRPRYHEFNLWPGVMTISASPAAADTATTFNALSPLRFPPGLRLKPEQFALLCAENREAVLELAADGRVLAMTPTGSETGARNSRLEMRLLLWADQQGGWKVFGSSTGFRLPDGSVLSPDASLVQLDRWQALTQEQRRGFAPLCPDLVVELAIPSDEGPRALTALRSKMASYQANGARLGWLLIPHKQAVEVWLASGDPQSFNEIKVLDAGPEFPGLQLQLAEIWAG